ncbi:MAG TPA: hypothetical protein DDZ96_05700 [Porphyromonadaceae bacterium]|jgi:hypothetical protein|nr:hypothetical protein [Porphyromonadaceae bacterium]HBL33300.1 hypothetical protein [Porphyromonadaceae bacterium]HCM22546.1 hypothetical protein [Porphyromonadaceae bacterium]
MNNQVNIFKPVTKISVPDTLLAMEVGDTVIISTRTIKTGSIRAAASRLERANKALFLVTEQGLVNETQVTRLK